MFERNHKTIFVLDHTRYFSISSEQYISLDFLKGKFPSGAAEGAGGAGGSALRSGDGTMFSKSLWTCAVESSIEYCRIVWDLFPGHKHVRFIVSDTAAHIVNTWSASTQNMSHVQNAMVMVGVPPRSSVQSSDYSVIHGLRAAIEAMAEPTDEQLKAMADGCQQISNKGRVICITSARDNTSMKSLEDIFNTVMIQQNALAAPPAKKGLVIDHCHLVILNIVPLGIESLVTNRNLLDISPLLAVEIHTVAAPEISSKLTHLIMRHYDLASTTVTNIPMKEEQNANSSANYDVEILHARSAHTVVCGKDVSVLPTSIKEGAAYETVTLKWCTPRGCGASDLQPCLGQYPVTPVDVTSRPSSCLINFLLNGRSVLLEMPRKSGGKTTSHMLSARGGEIFIHSLQITRSCLDETPSIVDGPGGRVQEYRFSEFAQHVKLSRLMPLKTKSVPPDSLRPEHERLCRRLRYFPLTTGTSILYHLQRQMTWLPHFLHLIVKEDMEKPDEVRCQQHIYELYTSASRGDMLPFAHTNGARLKGNKIKDQYRLFYRELEMLILMTGQTQTPHHKNLLESLQSLRTAYGDITPKTEPAHLRSYTESPLSPERLEPNTVISSSNSVSLLKASKRRMSGSGQRSLLDIISSAERSQSSKRLDFSGRLCTPLGQVAKLYPDFGNKEKDSPTPGSTPVSKEEPLRS
ncbi:protein asunder [Scaptodrosophila lebanonensis]|uniref:Protein asunder n=1 Tax=Drosophila lebanonensis TaxID=7225 RepID=A0A6J2TB16_DROLE|nr:protein asunder [Scaptodrosophila lebanonensis]